MSRRTMKKLLSEPQQAFMYICLKCLQSAQTTNSAYAGNVNLNIVPIDPSVCTYDLEHTCFTCNTIFVLHMDFTDKAFKEPTSKKEWTETMAKQAKHYK